MIEVVGKDCTLALGDCIKKLKEINDNTVDLVLTDPPYNLGLFMKGRDTNLGALRENHFVASSWDNDEQAQWEKHMNEFFRESARVLNKGGAIVVFMAVIKVETLIRIAQENGFYYKTTGSWHKTNPMPRNMNLHFINSTESWVYFVYGKKTGKFNNKGKAVHDFIETSVINNGEKKHGKHPTQKPVKLMEHFVELLSDKGDLVLDPFMGSGSTGVAVLNLNRQFYGIELSEEYFRVASLRVASLLEDSKAKT
ncbi:MAG: site-specific DNA-methyltransferase [Candidatus Saccharimonadales bacterium]